MKIVFLIFITVLTLFSTNVMGQEEKYRIQILNDGDVPQMQDISTSLKSLKSGSEAKGYKLIQFYALPSDDYKTKLKKAGIELVEYVPAYSYIVYIHRDASVTALKNNKIRTIIDLDNRFKLGRELYEERFKKSESTVKVRIYYHTMLRASDVQEVISGVGTVIEHFPEDGSIDAIISYAVIDSLILNKDIRYLEKIKEPVVEDVIMNTSGRTNWLNSSSNDQSFSGLGVMVAVDEGGIYNVNNKIELQGRFQENGGGNASSHKTSVAIHMASAGNLNPLNTGIAQGARVISQNNGSKDRFYFDNDTLVAINHSYGYGIGTSGWGTGTNHDRYVRDSVGAFHVWSAGNQYSNASTYGSYAGLEGYANLTGGIKMAKNTFTVGSVNQYDQIMSHSSKGPTIDGRIKPDIMVEGRGGTSLAAPKITGIIAQLTEVYQHYNDKLPYLPVIKAILLNTCDDMENPGPDFRTGYGRVNVRRAHETIKNNQIFDGAVDNNQSISYKLNVPENVKELRVLIHWPDYPSTKTVPLKALVNDIDLSLTDPLNKTHLPWILSHYAHLDSLSKPADRGVDHLNNAEQVSVLNPVAGDYKIDITGNFIPQGPQRFFVTYEFLYNELTLTYPIGNEHLVPGESEYILWDSYGNTGNELFDLDYTMDDGATWVNIAKQLSSTSRVYKWTVPKITSGHVKVRVKRGEISSTSKKAINISSKPMNPQVIWRTDSSALIDWGVSEQGVSYRVNVLGRRIMEPFDSTKNTHYVINGLESNREAWVSIQKLNNNNAVSRRTNAVKVSATNFNEIKKIGLHPFIKSDFIPYQLYNGKHPVAVIVRNEGVEPISNFKISYTTFLGQSAAENIIAEVSPGHYYWHTMSDSLLLSSSLETDTIKVWAEAIQTDVINSDTISIVIRPYDTQIIQPPYGQNFDKFSNCSRRGGCEGVSCSLSDGWFNVLNNSSISIDMIDWRVTSDGTPTGGTGPVADHTSGGGKYLYLEGSGNSGKGCKNKTALVHSPCIDLSSASKGDSLSFWYHMHGSSMGSLHLDVYLNNKWINDVVLPISGQQSNSWQQFKADLTPYLGQIVIFRIRGITGNGWLTDMAIDDFALRIKPKASFNISDTIACIGQQVELSNTSVYSDGCKWTISPDSFIFENGTDRNSENPVMRFTEPGEYSIMLKCLNQYGSDSVSYTNKVDWALGVERKIAGNEKFKMYPNPADGIVYIKPVNIPNKVYQIKITSITGVREQYRVYKLDHAITCEISLSNYRAGVYLVSLIDVENHTIIKTQKLVVY